MGAKKSHSVDKNSGKITQVNYTEKRSDGKIETRHLNPDNGKYTGKSVHSTDTGKTDDYTREEAAMGEPCYLTTACTNFMELPDNCLELNVLRKFRDKILLSNQSGRRAVQEYYHIAPEIIQAIEKEDDTKRIWKNVYGNIKQAVSFILSGDFERAFNHYQQMTSKLKNKYID